MQRLQGCKGFRGAALHGSRLQGCRLTEVARVAGVGELLVSPKPRAQSPEPRAQSLEPKAESLRAESPDDALSREPFSREPF